MTSIETFRRTLYAEHLEEASALYQLRNSLLAEPDRAWRSLFDFEARLEAHIDALVIGGPLALQVCGEQMEGGDAGELFAGLCVCCRQQETSLVAAMWRQLDFADASRVRAVTDALKFELPDAWVSAVEKAIASPDRNRASILMVAAAYRRLPVGAAAAAHVDAERAGKDPRLIWALSRLAGTGVNEALARSFRSPDPDVRSHALLGLLRAGEMQAFYGCYLNAQTEDWPHLALGMAGDRQAATILRQRVEAGHASSRTVLALGLLGDVTSVRALTALLNAEDVGPVAALALHWITGAPLYEEVFVPDPVDETELFERERAAWLEHGTVPTRADGRPYGSTIRRLTQDRALWDSWLREHAAEFHPDVRYRRGHPYSPRALLDCLLADVAPADLRQLAAEELAVRYGCRVPFEADARVVDQLASLERIAQWTNDNEDRFAHSSGAFFRGAA